MPMYLKKKVLLISSKVTSTQPGFYASQYLFLRLLLLVLVLSQVSLPVKIRKTSEPLAYSRIV